MSITSDELNFLVYRYLQESGFVHSAFVFAYESLVGRSDIATVDIPPGSLINFLQKGLQYVEIERELEQQGEPDASKGILPNEGSAENRIESGTNKDLSNKDGMEIDDGDKRVLALYGSNGENKIPRNANTWLSPSDVTELKGHTDEVLACAWNPVKGLLVSGSCDSTIRLWDIPMGASGFPTSRVVSMSSVLLKNVENTTESSSNDPKPNNQPNGSNALSNRNGVRTNGMEDVTSLSWKPDGELIASGSFLGIIRIHDVGTSLKRTIKGHTGAVFSVKWSPGGKYLASGSVDKTAIVWDPENGEVIKKCTKHKAPVLDLNWRDDSVFATCGADKTIYIISLGEEEPIATLTGHTDDVNEVQWSPSGKLLASCSDDATAKIWSVDGDETSLVHTLEEHSRDVHQVRWAPRKKTEEDFLLLATASFDTTIKLWDAEGGTCLYSLTDHTREIYTISFSPCAGYLASGSSDATLRIWDVKEGTCLKKHRGAGRIFEVCWNKEGDKVAACFGLPSNCVSVIDLKK